MSAADSPEVPAPRRQRPPLSIPAVHLTVDGTSSAVASAADPTVSNATSQHRQHGGGIVRASEVRSMTFDAGALLTTSVPSNAVAVGAVPTPGNVSIHWTDPDRYASVRQSDELTLPPATAEDRVRRFNEDDSLKSVAPAQLHEGGPPVTAPLVDAVPSSISTSAPAGATVHFDGTAESAARVSAPAEASPPIPDLNAFQFPQDSSANFQTVPSLRQSSASMQGGATSIALPPQPDDAGAPEAIANSRPALPVLVSPSPPIDRRRLPLHDNYVGPERPPSDVACATSVRGMVPTVWCVDDEELIARFIQLFAHLSERLKSADDADEVDPSPTVGGDGRRSPRRTGDQRSLVRPLGKGRHGTATTVVDVANRPNSPPSDNGARDRADLQIVADASASPPEQLNVLTLLCFHALPRLARMLVHVETAPLLASEQLKHNAGTQQRLKAGLASRRTFINRSAGSTPDEGAAPNVGSQRSNSVAAGPLESPTPIADGYGNAIAAGGPPPRTVPSGAIVVAIETFLELIAQDVVVVRASHSVEAQVRMDLMLAALTSQWEAFAREHCDDETAAIILSEQLVKTASARLVTGSSKRGGGGHDSVEITGCRDFMSTAQTVASAIAPDPIWAATLLGHSLPPVTAVHAPTNNSVASENASVAIPYSPPAAPLPRASTKPVLTQSAAYSPPFVCDSNLLLPSSDWPLGITRCMPRSWLTVDTLVVHGVILLSAALALALVFSVAAFASNRAFVAMLSFVCAPIVTLAPMSIAALRGARRRSRLASTLNRATSRIAIAATLRTAALGPPLAGASRVGTNATYAGAWAALSRGAASGEGSNAISISGVVGRQPSIQQQSATASTSANGGSIPLPYGSTTTTMQPTTTTSAGGARGGGLLAADGPRGRRLSGTANPLSQVTTSDFATNGAAATGGRSDEDLSMSTVRVKIDESGTFLLPFGTGLPPIVLDGYHIHANLGIIGMELPRVNLTLEDLETTTASHVRRRASAKAGGSAAEPPPPSRIASCSLCMWNHAVGDFTGFSDSAVVGRPFGDVLADNASLDVLERRILAIEREVLDPTYGFSLEPILINVVHKVHGTVQLRVTVAPITQPLLDPRTNEEVDAMVGALILGVPVDVRSVMASVSLRNGNLSEVLEQLLIELAPVAGPGASSMLRGGTSPRSAANALSVTTGVPTPLQSHEAVERRRRFNEIMAAVALRNVGVAEPMQDINWSAVTKSFVASEFNRLALALRFRLIMDDALPDVIECDVASVSAIVRSALMSAPLAKKEINVVVSCTSQEGCVLFVSFVGMDTASAFRDMATICEDQPSPIATLMQQGGVYALISTDMAIAAAAGLRQGTASSSASSGSGLANAGSWHHAALPTPTEHLVLLFPYRRHTGNIWSRQNVNAYTSIEAANMRTSRNTLINQMLGAPTADSMAQNGGAMNGSNNVAAGHGLANVAADVLTVMLCERNELARHRFSVELWKRSHSVITIDDGNFFKHGVKILRSSMRRVDVVHLGRLTTLPVEQLVQVATDFPDVVFYVEWQCPEESDAATLNGSSAVGKSGGGGLNATRSGAGTVRRRSLRPADADTAALTSDTSGDAAKAAAVNGSAIATLTGLRNVSLHRLVPSEAMPVLDALESIGKRVAVIREERARRLQLERALREHRSQPWTKGKKLGRGTFGDVYEANLTLTGGTMAVKTVQLPANDQARIDAFINEVTILSTLQHPNIVQYFYCEPGTEGEVNIFMELCKGGSLADVIKKSRLSGTRVDADEVAAIMQQVVAALAYLHDRNIVHRDIKPANVLINGCMKLADFGTATANNASGVRDTAGTLQYMAPEVYAGVSSYGLPCDVWSIGVLALDLLGIEPPVLARNTKIAFLGACDTDTELWEGLTLPDELVEDFLWQCLRVEPKDRTDARTLLQHDWLRDARRTFGVARRSSISLRSRLRRVRASGDGPVAVTASTDAAIVAAAAVTPVAQLSRCLSLCSSAGEAPRSADDDALIDPFAADAAATAAAAGHGAGADTTGALLGASLKAAVSLQGALSLSSAAFEASAMAPSRRPRPLDAAVIGGAAPTAPTGEVDLQVATTTTPEQRSNVWRVGGVGHAVTPQWLAMLQRKPSLVSPSAQHKRTKTGKTSGGGVRSAGGETPPVAACAISSPDEPLPKAKPASAAAAASAAASPVFFGRNDNVVQEDSILSEF